MERYMEVADVARREGITTASVRADVALGRLRVAARTARGTRLFVGADVEAYQLSRRDARLDGLGGAVELRLSRAETSKPCRTARRVRAAQRIAAHFMGAASAEPRA